MVLLAFNGLGSALLALTALYRDLLGFTGL